MVVCWCCGVRGGWRVGNRGIYRTLDSLTVVGFTGGRRARGGRGFLRWYRSFTICFNSRLGGDGWKEGGRADSRAFLGEGLACRPRVIGFHRQDKSCVLDRRALARRGSSALRGTEGGRGGGCGVPVREGEGHRSSMSGGMSVSYCPECRCAGGGGVAGIAVVSVCLLGGVGVAAW